MPRRVRLPGPTPTKGNSRMKPHAGKEFAAFEDGRLIHATAAKVKPTITRIDGNSTRRALPPARQPAAAKIPAAGSSRSRKPAKVSARSKVARKWAAGAGECS